MGEGERRQRGEGRRKEGEEKKEQTPLHEHIDISKYRQHVVLVNRFIAEHLN